MNFGEVMSGRSNSQWIGRMPKFGSTSLGYGEESNEDEDPTSDSSSDESSSEDGSTETNNSRLYGRTEQQGSTTANSNNCSSLLQIDGEPMIDTLNNDPVKVFQASSSNYTSNSNCSQPSIVPASAPGGFYIVPAVASSEASCFATSNHASNSGFNVPSSFRISLLSGNERFLDGSNVKKGNAVSEQFFNPINSLQGQNSSITTKTFCNKNEGKMISGSSEKMHLAANSNTDANTVKKKSASFVSFSSASFCAVSNSTVPTSIDSSVPSCSSFSSYDTSATLLNATFSAITEKESISCSTSERSSQQIQMANNLSVDNSCNVSLEAMEDGFYRVDVQKRLDLGLTVFGVPSHWSPEYLALYISTYCAIVYSFNLNFISASAASNLPTPSHLKGCQVHMACKDMYTKQTLLSIRIIPVLVNELLGSCCLVIRPYCMFIDNEQHSNPIFKLKDIKYEKFKSEVLLKAENSICLKTACILALQQAISGRIMPNDTRNRIQIVWENEMKKKGRSAEALMEYLEYLNVQLSLFVPPNFLDYLHEIVSRMNNLNKNNPSSRKLLSVNDLSTCWNSFKVKNLLLQYMSKSKVSYELPLQHQSSMTKTHEDLLRDVFAATNINGNTIAQDEEDASGNFNFFSSNKMNNEQSFRKRGRKRRCNTGEDEDTQGSSETGSVNEKFLGKSSKKSFKSASLDPSNVFCSKGKIVDKFYKNVKNNEIIGGTIQNENNRLPIYNTQPDAKFIKNGISSQNCNISLSPHQSPHCNNGLQYDASGESEFVYNKTSQKLVSVLEHLNKKSFCEENDKPIRPIGAVSGCMNDSNSINVINGETGVDDFGEQDKEGRRVLYTGANYIGPTYDKTLGAIRYEHARKRWMVDLYAKGMRVQRCMAIKQYGLLGGLQEARRFRYSKLIEQGMKIDKERETNHIIDVLTKIFKMGLRYGIDVQDLVNAMITPLQGYECYYAGIRMKNVMQTATEISETKQKISEYRKSRRVLKKYKTVNTEYIPGELGEADFGDERFINDNHNDDSEEYDDDYNEND